MAEPLWTWGELVAATGGTAEGEAPGGVAGVSIDTRTLQPGDLFVALRGDNQNGEAFVTKAFEKGAAAALVSRDFVTPAPVVSKSNPLTPALSPTGRGGYVLIRVEDTLKALERLGVAARARLSPEARVIAVTGSVGKTSTKEMLRVCLSSVAPGHTHASDKSYNNHWGVPLTLARMPAGTRYGVFEIGMNHAGEITPLSKMVRPHVAIVTTVGPVHLGHFKSVEEIADAKAEIFAGLESPLPLRQGERVRVRGSDDASGPGLPLTPTLSPQEGRGGEPSLPVAVLNADDGWLGRLRAAAEIVDARVVTFGRHERNDADFRLIANSAAGDSGGMDVVARSPVGPLAFRLKAAGQHQALNALAAFAAVHGIDAELESAKVGIGAFLPTDGRGSIHVYRLGKGQVAFRDESYNANPLSMAAALHSIVGALEWNLDKPWRRIAVLGDMRELGEDSSRLHRELIEPITAAKIDKVFACGSYMRELYDLLPAATQGAYAEKSEGLIAPLLAAIRPGDVIMVKGSLGTRMAPIVEALKAHLTALAEQT